MSGFPPDVDLFAGPGGTSSGLRMIAPYRGVVGVEIDPAANATAEKAQFLRLHGDVTRFREDFGKCGVGGLMASPPCPSFSAAGTGLGRVDAVAIRGALAALAYDYSTPMTLARLDAVMAELRPEMLDERSLLVLEPLWWILRYQPEWVFLEQVAPVEEIWLLYSGALARFGYSSAVSTVRAEQYGLAQTRPRAILLASRTRDAEFPLPTHARFSPKGEYTGVLPAPRGMRDVLLNRADEFVMEHRRGGGMAARHGVRPGRDWRQPSFAVTGARGGGSHRLYLTDVATGVSAPLQLGEAAALQTFPPDYPWQGGVTATRRMIGDAVPPRLAATLLEGLIGHE